MRVHQDGTRGEMDFSFYRDLTLSINILYLCSIFDVKYKIMVIAGVAFCRTMMMKRSAPETRERSLLLPSTIPHEFPIRMIWRDQVKDLPIGKRCLDSLENFLYGKSKDGG